MPATQLYSFGKIYELLFSHNSIEPTMQEVLRHLGELLRVSRVSLVLKNSDPAHNGGYAANQSWTVSSLNGQTSNTQRYEFPLPNAEMKNWEDAFSERRSVEVNKIDLAIKDQRGFTKQGIHTLIAIPMLFENKLLGFLQLDECQDANRAWSEEETMQYNKWATLIAASLNCIEPERPSPGFTNCYQQILESLSQGVLILNLQLELVYVNQAFLDMIDYGEKGDMLGKSIFAFAHNFEIEKFNFLILPHVIANGSWKGEMPLHRNDGFSLPAIFNFLLMKKLQGESQNIVVLVEDVSNQKVADKQQKVFHDLAQRLTNPLTMKDAGKIIAESAYALFRHHSFAIDFVYDSEKLLTGIYAEDTLPGDELPREMPTKSHPIEEIINKDVFAGNAKLVNRKAEPMKSEFFSFGEKTRLSRSLMFAPIRFEHKIVGMIYVQSYTPYRYNADDLNVFRSLADHAGSTMMRIQAEEVLNKEKKLYHEVIDQQTEMICRVKPEGTLVFVNEAFARLNGEPRSALIGRNILSYVDSEAIEIFNEALAYLRPENPVFFAEHPLRTYTGKMVWISWTLLALFNEQGEIVELQAVGKDITGRKAAEDALLESKKRFEVLSQATFEAIFISENGICFEQNKTAEMIFGYSKNEAIGRPCTDWIAEQDRERVNQYLLTDYDQPYEVLAQRKDGSTFLAEIRGRTMDYRGVKVRIKALRDISRLKAAEDKIRASLREKEILLSEIHHRVKNNMQAISSLLNLQAEQFEDSTYASLFKESRDRIKSMALIHDRLYHAEDFSGINISSYIATLARYLFRSYGISSDKIELKMHVANVELSLEKAIPCGLIINELLSNAIKYAFPGERRGMIRISMQMKNENDVELIVSNDGQALPESFDIHNTKTLGLHLVSLLVLDQLRGTIEVDGKNGASFLIHFSAKS